MAAPVDKLAETGADWRGTPLAADALAVWVVGNNTAVEGLIVSWDRDYVTVQPLRRSYSVVGGVARSEERDVRPQTVAREKVTVIVPVTIPTPVDDGGWHPIDMETGLAEVMPAEGQFVFLSAFRTILGRYRTDLVDREIAPGVPCRPWCDRFGNSLTHVPEAWRPLDNPPIYDPQRYR